MRTLVLVRKALRELEREQNRIDTQIQGLRKLETAMGGHRKRRRRRKSKDTK